MSVNVKMTAIADAIRSKTGKTAPLSLDGMAVEIDNMAVTAKLTGLTIHRAPTKTQYDDGETFDRTGMEVHAAYDDGHFLDVTAVASYEPDRPLTVGDTSITISYADGGVTKTATQAISVVAPPSATLSANSWETISRVAAAGMAQTYWKTGDETTVQMDGTNYAVRIIDFNHDDLDASDPRYNDATYNGGTNKAAITFEFKECYGTTYRMHNSDDNSVSWQGCEMRTSTAPTLIGKLPAALQSALCTVKKLTAQSGSSSTILTTADKLWPLSEVEVWGTNGYSKPGEGTRYAFYTAGNSHIKNRNGTSAWWWLRSPYSGSGYYFLYVHIDGTLGSNNASSTGGSVAFGFNL